jgi:hypothetical protein
VNNSCKRLILLFILLALCTEAFPAELAEIDTSGAVKTVEPSIDAGQAIDLAVKFSGLHPSGVDSRASWVWVAALLRADSVPLLSVLGLGQSEVWRVGLPPHDVGTTQRVVEGRIMKRFDVYLDAHTGNPLLVHGYAYRPEDRARCDTISYPDDPEREDGSWLTGIPEEPPKATFMEAVDKDYFCGARHACGIKAWYVISACAGAKSVPVWAIETFSQYPTASSGKSAADDRTWWTVVNAATGSVVVSTNTPCPHVVAPSEGE